MLQMLLTKALRVMSINRADLRVVREKTEENIIPFVSTFNHKNPEMFHTMRPSLSILYEDETMKEILQEYQIIKSKRQPWNLKRLLTRAKFNETLESPKLRDLYATDLIAEFVYI